MNKHGMSHAIAILVCTLSSGLLIQLAWQHFPVINRVLDFMSILIIRALGLSISTQSMSVLMLATILGLIWGMAFARLSRS